LPRTETRIFIPRPPGVVYRASKDVAALEEYLPSVEKITALEVTPTRTRHRFEARAAGRKVSYVEVENWDDATLTNSFYSPEGDFSKYEGRYTYTPVEGGTEFGLELDWELNIPLLGALLKNLLGKIVQENADELASGVKAYCLART
jgi:ribosome-associated toxin RatA of RatAB toxin-antitoxin module